VTPLPDGTVPVGMAPDSVAEVVWTLRSDVPVTQTKTQTEYYAPMVATDINKGITVPIDVADPPPAGAPAFLRLGIYTDDPLGAQQLAMTFNGKPLKVVWSAQPTDLDSSGPTRTTWCVRMPLPAGSVTKDNRLVFGPQDTDYRLMFAAVECSKTVAK
jgi:hypothetical protein